MQDVVAVALIRNGRVLAARRTAPPDLAGRWECPGGKVEPGESLAAAAVREYREEFGAAIEPGSAIGTTLDYPARGVRLHLLRARLVSGTPRPAVHDAMRWLGPEELDELDWLPTDRPWLPPLREVLLDGERLPGGQVGGAVRIGDTVRRPTGPWTPAVHDLLRYLRCRGLRYIPAVRGIDVRGREILDYLPGEVVDIDRDRLTDAQLASAGRWLRHYHDTVRDYRPPGGPRWRSANAAVGPGEIVCHNDFATDNLAFGGDELVGVFDWDVCGPGRPIDDLAFATWNCLPLYRDVEASDAARRLAILADAYGDTTPDTVLAEVVRRMRTAVERIATGQRAGDPGMLALGAAGEPARTRGRIERLVTVLPKIETHLADG